MTRNESVHRHDWDLLMTELGDTWGRCECGQERLLTGTVVRGKRKPDANWETPKAWNEAWYRRERT